jgi:hypothetical protein
VLSAEKGAEPLETAEQFSGAFGFIIDVRLNEDSGKPKINVLGAGIEIGSDEPWEKIGRWNRIEGRMDTVTLGMGIKVNGKESQLVYQLGLPIGPIQLIPDGPVDWANPYVRSLKQSE